MDAVIFDLDDTLVADEASASTAFLKTCLYAQSHYGMNLPGFQTTIREACREYWQQSPAVEYCDRVGISSSEGLWATFAGPGQNLSLLRRWSPVYRKMSWLTTLRKFKIDDEDYALKMAAKYILSREELQVVYRDVEPVLASLKPYFKLGLLTNGAPDLQRRKIALAGLEKYFDAIVVSGEYGLGKPDRRIFEWILALLDVPPQNALMVGDCLKSDVGGAQAAGLRAAWVNRLDEKPEGSLLPDYIVKNLYDLRNTLEQQVLVIPESGSVFRLL